MCSRTVEALALALEARDGQTHDHVRRVQIYAAELGKKLALPRREQKALWIAAVLHDIGKLAVPEHILSKPRRLTAEEFEKVKVHPVVGAEILEQVKFPYPVVPIVLSHHEKWDGSGYPHGLKREEIPIGARILAAVDCLDALASDRDYRAALSLEDAMASITSEANRSFDPNVVAALRGCYQELERKARSVQVLRPQLSKNIKIENGREPGAGLEAPAREIPSLAS